MTVNKLIVSISLLLTFLISCVNNNSDPDNSKIIYVFNPLEEVINVKIDGNELKILPMDASPVKLNTGSHLIEFHELKDSFNVYLKSNLAINPLLDTLIMEEILYVPNEQKGKEFTEKDYNIKFNVLNINNLMYYGPFKLTNDLYIRDWDYGPSYPVNSELNDNSQIKVKLNTKSLVMKVYGLNEFIDNYTSVNHTEEYISEILPRYLTNISNDINLEVHGDVLLAGIEKNLYDLADIHVTAEEKLYIKFREEFDPAIHGEKKFTIKDCTVEINGNIIKGVNISGVSVSKSDSLILVLD